MQLRGPEGCQSIIWTLQHFSIVIFISLSKSSEVMSLLFINGWTVANNKHILSNTYCEFVWSSMAASAWRNSSCCILVYFHSICEVWFWQKGAYTQSDLLCSSLVTSPYMSHWCTLLMPHAKFMYYCTFLERDTALVAIKQSYRMRIQTPSTTGDLILQLQLLLLEISQKFASR
jgi:hypothetical protein